MTHSLTNDREVALGIDTDPRLDPVHPAAGLHAQLARLDAVATELAAPPVDRDPVLWAAHEFARCAALLIDSRASGDTPSDLGAALDHARSAMVSLTMARRHEVDSAR